MVLKFYYDLASPPVRAVYFTIKNLNIPVELIEVKIRKGESKSEEFLKMNPFGTLPCIDDDGFILADSHAINVYLATKYPGGDKLYPSEPKKCAMVNERLFFESCELFATLKAINKKIIFEGLSVLGVDIVNRFETCYEGLEIYLKDSHYIAGNNLTIADFSVVTTLYVPICKKKFPLLNAYLQRAAKWPYYEQINVPGIKLMFKFLKIRNIQVLQHKL